MQLGYIANVSNPYVLAGTTYEARTFPFSFLEIFLSTIAPSTFLHALASACILRRTSASTRPFSVIFPPRYTTFLTCLMFFPSNLRFSYSLCFPTSVGLVYLLSVPIWALGILLLLYGYYQSRFGLIPRSRGGRWGLIKATVCSKILQMFVRY